MSGEQQDGAAGRAAMEASASELAAFADAWDAAGLPNTVAHTARASRDGERPGVYRQKLTVQTLRAVLAERDALAARIAELEGEREADTQAAAEALSVYGDAPYLGLRERVLIAACAILQERFADRIAAQAGDETDGSGT